MKHTSTDFGALVRSCRHAQGISQAELAEEVVCSKTWISKIEKGAIPHSDLVDDLDRVLNADQQLINSARSLRRHPRIRYTVQLPAAPTLTGRNDELAQLHSELDPARYRTPMRVLTGPAGVGKTALAVHWAHRAADRYPDGILYARLHAHTYHRAPADPRDVLADLLVGLGVSQLPGSLEARSTLLATLLTDRRVLLILDDAESAEQIRPLVPGGHECAVLVTSRHRLPGLGIRGHARHLHLPALSPQSATALLADQLDLHGEEAEVAVAHLAVRCDNLPLALLAAAEYAHNHAADLPALTAALTGHDRLRLLDDAADGDPEASLVAAYNTSYRHLSASAASTLIQLACGTRRSSSDPAIRELAREHLVVLAGSEKYVLPSLVAEWAASQLEYPPVGITRCDGGASSPQIHTPEASSSGAHEAVATANATAA